MGDGYNFQQLKSEILARSKAQDWAVAKKEWKLVAVSEADEPETCLCGHTPIIELCTIRNSVTGNSVEVGNVCVKRFLGLRSDLIFQSIKRIRKDPDKGLNADATAFFYEQGIVNDWEYKFQQSTMRKRVLTAAQASKRHAINAKVLAALKRRGLQ